jgi:hypothetical protein
MVEITESEFANRGNGTPLQADRIKDDPDRVNAHPSVDEREANPQNTECSTGKPYTDSQLAAMREIKQGMRHDGTSKTFEPAPLPESS